MKKMIVALVCALSFTNIVSAQQFTNVIVANGGKYEFMDPYVDKATIGAFDAVQGKYWVFDTIQVESVQDLVIEGNYAYLAAESKVIKYDLTTYKRIDELDYPGVMSVSLHDTLMFVGKFYGAGAFLSVYDNRDFSFLFDVTEIDQTVVDVAVVGDTAYVPYNQKGVVDQYPPYMVFADTLGKVGVVDIKNQSFVRNIELDTIGAGAKNAFVYNNTVVVTCEVNGTVAKYNALDTSLDFDTVGVSLAIAMEDSLLIAHFGGVVGTYDFVQGSSTTTSLGFSVPSYYYGAGTYDTLNNQLVVTETNFQTYGKTHIYTNGGVFVDTFDVNVSPQAIAIDYKTGAYAPVALDDYTETMEDSSGITVDVLFSDFDPNGDGLTISILTNGAGGVATISNDSINYVPNTGFYGLDTVEYKICDGALCDSAYLVINVVHISGVREVLPISQLEIYPNPAIDVLNFSTTMLGSKQVSIFNVKGQIVRSESFFGTKSNISVSELPKGAYIVKISNGKSVEIGRLLVE